MATKAFTLILGVGRETFPSKQSVGSLSLTGGETDP